jgi:O-antigen/teichoic acid export membrane protein
VLIWNPSFLHLWVGSKNFAGPLVNLLIVLVISQTAFIRTDSYIIDAALRPRGRVVIGALTVIATLALGITLTHLFGIIGLCVGLFLGRSIQSISYPIFVRSCLENPPHDRSAQLQAIRLFLVTAVLFGGATVLGNSFHASRWVTWAAGVAVTVPAIAGLALLLGPTPTTRRMLLGRLRVMVNGLRPRRA